MPAAKQTKGNKNEQKLPSGDKPNIPEQGLLNSSPGSNPETTLKNWRRIILAAITPQSKKITPDKSLSKITIPTPAKKPPTSSNAKEKIFVRIAVYLLLAPLTIFFILGYAVYNFNWRGEISNKITQFISFPAALIKTPCGYRSLTITEFNQDLKALNSFYEQKTAADENFLAPNPEQIKNDIISKELKNKLTKCFAQKRNLKITKEELKEELEKTIVQAGSEKSLAEIVKNLYGWNLKIFQEKILYIYLLENKLAENLRNDPEIYTSSYKKIQTIQEKVKKNPQNFYSLVKEYSEDNETQHRGGDLNWLEKGQLDQSLENTAFGLAVGEISDIIQTPAGFHLLKVTDKKTTPEGIEQIRLSHLLIKTPTIQHWLDEKLKQSEIYIFY